MCTLFDITRGILCINKNIFFYENMRPEEILSKGIKFNYQQPMGIGWMFKSLRALCLGREKVFNLYFYECQLRNFSFSLWEPEDGYDSQKTFERQNIFLRQELGKTQDVSEHHVVYHYPWGRITSGIDYKTGDARIIMSWEKRSPPE